ncbi:MAG TPA: hypothetical protein VM686_32545 [Polyangiaceae bacterium]|jgi:hypothetical protein|nr:hypothetical protein [Polyangiaceae bacterium]
MARLTLVRTFVLGVAFAFTVAQGCAKQGEGERCEPNSAQDDDCDDGLDCVPGKELLDNVTTADDFGRCCPPVGQAISDDRCARAGLSGGGSGGTSAEGGAAGTPGMAGMAGEGVVSSGGAGGDVSSGGMSGGGAGGQPPTDGGASGAPAAGAPGAGGQGGAPAIAGAGGV